MGTLDPAMYESKNSELEQWFVDHPAPIQKAAAAAAAAAESEANAEGEDGATAEGEANSDGENSEAEEGNESGSEDEEGDVEDVEEEDEEMAVLRANMVRTVPCRAERGSGFEGFIGNRSMSALHTRPEPNTSSLHHCLLCLIAHLIRRVSSCRSASSTSTAPLLPSSGSSRELPCGWRSYLRARPQAMSSR